MYQFVGKDERNHLVRVCEQVILDVQKLVKGFFTFEFRLIGSGEKRLITRNGPDGSCDLDYNLILHKDKQNLGSNPEKIKNIFLQAFRDVNPGYSFQNANNSTSVITSKRIQDNRLLFSMDVAILFEGNNGNYYKLIFDKSTNRYLWNEIPKSRDHFVKFKNIKETGHWSRFQQRYLELKNYHLSRNDGMGSFSIFLETLNEF